MNEPGQIAAGIALASILYFGMGALFSQAPSKLNEKTAVVFFWPVVASILLIKFVLIGLQGLWSFIFKDLE